MKLVKETNIIDYKDLIDNNELKIIKDGRKQYYLIDNNLYKIKKNKSQGKFVGNYIDGKIIEN